MTEIQWPDIEDRYYDEEYQYLIDAGREYAKLHPERARYLNLDDPRARDPHVERLIEAFAFLTGRVRRKIEDEFPELSQTLLTLLWPQYLRPIPPMSVLEFRPLPGLTEPRVVPEGFLVDSEVTSEGVPCRFRTAYPVEVYPIRLQEVGFATDDAGQRSLDLRFSVSEGAQSSGLVVNRLRFFLAGEPGEAYRIYRLLRTAVDSIEVSFSQGRSRSLPADAIRAVGFDPGEVVLPYPEYSFPGYRLLSEFFNFREKFLFLDVTGIGSIPLEKDAGSFALRVRFRERPPENLRPTSDSFSLFSTPIVNLFPWDGEPIKMTHLKAESEVLADYSHPSAYEVVSVDRVQAWRKGARAARSIPSFYSFLRGEEEGELTFRTSQKVRPSGRWTTRIGLASRARGVLPEEETLSLDLTCSNGRLCREVGIDAIKTAAGNPLDFVKMSNVTKPTEPIYPEMGDGSEWKFISHMALNHVSLSHIETLRTVLGLYSLGNRPENNRILEGLKKLESHPRRILIEGAVVSGTELTLTVDEQHFDEAGELLLFGDVLNRFLSLYSNINSFTELVIRQLHSGELRRCPTMVGKQTLI